MTIYSIDRPLAQPGPGRQTDQASGARDPETTGGGIDAARRQAEAGIKGKAPLQPARGPSREAGAKGEGTRASPPPGAVNIDWFPSVGKSASGQTEAIRRLRLGEANDQVCDRCYRRSAGTRGNI